jgi:portal protein
MSYLADGDDDPTLKGDERIVHRAHSRMKRCKDFYDTAYGYSLEDTKFANADDRNKAQWPDKIFADRDGKRKPCLTINIVQPHNRLVINESMQNKASIRIRATGGKATADAAEGMQMLVERTEYISSATIAYRTAITHQVDGGFGYLFLDTAFVDDKSFNQDVYIDCAEDPRAVYLDPDSVMKGDGTSAEFGFIFQPVPRDRFNREYPKFKDRIGSSTLGQDMLWINDKYVLVAKYYERASKNDELIWYRMDDGSEFTGHRSQMEADSSKEMVDAIIEQIESGQIEGKFRDVVTQDVNWYQIGGDCILKRGDKPSTRWIGKYVPIVPCYGIKTFIEGKFDCKSHTRSQISPQQMLNYNASGQVQFGALQSQTPFIGPLHAFETNEKEWANANIENYAYLAYDDWYQEEGEAGRTLEKPERQQPPQIAPVFMQGMQDAERWSMMVTGQWQASQGQENPNGVESDKTINARQRTGNVATYHFTEHQYDMYRNLGKQLIDIYPKLYDTKRILHVEGEDLSKKILTIDPDAEEAFKRIKKETETAEEIVFNPLVGEYEVLSDPGPNHATQRQQAFDAISEIIAQNKELGAIVGDILFKNGDFAGAQQLAERMQKFIKHTSPWLFDDGDNPQLAALQQQFEEVQKLNSELLFKLAEEKLKVRGRDERNDIKAFEADTHRMGEVTNRDKMWIEAVVENVIARQRGEHELAKQANQHVYNVIEQANQADLTPSADEGMQ